MINIVESNPPFEKRSRLSNAGRALRSGAVFGSIYFAAMAGAKELQHQSLDQWTVPFVHLQGNALLPLAAVAIPTALHMMNELITKPYDSIKGIPVDQKGLRTTRASLFRDAAIDAAKYVALGGLAFGDQSAWIFGPLAVASMPIKDSLLSYSYSKTQETLRTPRRQNTRFV